MEQSVNLNKVYAKSEDVVAREIQGEFIIIPVTSGIADMEDELFSLNESGKAIWEKLDGKKALKEIVQELTAEFEAPNEQIENDVTGIAGELLKRRMLVERS